jgi:hypothetical protein
MSRLAAPKAWMLDKLGGEYTLPPLIGRVNCLADRESLSQELTPLSTP